MHKTVEPPFTNLAHYSESKSARSVPRWLQIEFWLPLLLVSGFIIVVSSDYKYAAAGGAEIYQPRVQSNSIRQFAFLGLGSIGFYLLTLARPVAAKPQIAWTILLPTLGLTGYIFLSIFWSDDSLMTFKRAITASLVIVAGLGIGRVWSMRDYAWGITIISTLFLVASVLVELKFRSFLSVSEYRFSGIFHPAKQAFNCGFLLVASLAIYFSQGRRLILFIAVAALAFLLLTKARTGTAAALLACGWLTWHCTSVRGWLIVGVAGFGLAISCLLFYQGVTGRDLDTTTVTTMGRDEDSADPTKLTGRLPIWTQAFNEFTKQPILGFGYGAFWTMGRLAEFERPNGWALFHSHSTYLESLLNLGMVGFALGLITLAVVFHRSMTLRRQGDGLAILISSVFLLAFVGGFFEIAFIGLEYESLVLMTGIGVMTFAEPPNKRSVR